MFEKTNMVVTKLTRDCNLRCKYCYVRDKDKFSGELMEFNVFKALIDRIVRDKEIVGKKNHISIVLHGGEPTLMPPLEMTKFLSYAKRTFEKNQIPYSFSIQTNATNLTDELLQVFKDYGVSVGISFDGVAESNSLRTAKSTVFYEEVIEKFKKYNIDYGLIMVVNPMNINYVSRNIEYIENVLKVSGYKVNYAEDVLSLGNCEVTGYDFFEKVQKIILQDCIYKNIKLSETNLFRIIEKYFKNRFFGESVPDISSGNCEIKICGGGINIIEINPDGTISFCGRYSEDYPDVSLGSIFDKDFLSLRSIGLYFNAVKAKHRIIRETGCDLCSADNICDHGCIAFHRSKLGEWGIRKDLVCEIFKPLKSYISKNEKDIFKIYFNSKANSSGLFYLRAEKAITGNDISKISRMLDNCYQVEPDYNFKTDREKREGETYQIIIKRRENELHNNEKLQ